MIHPGRGSCRPPISPSGCWAAFGKTAASHSNTRYDKESGALFGRQYVEWELCGTHRICGLQSGAASSYSGDRTQFLGRNRTACDPASLERVRLDNRTGARLDPPTVCSSSGAGTWTSRQKLFSFSGKADRGRSAGNHSRA